VLVEKVISHDCELEDGQLVVKKGFSFENVEDLDGLPEWLRVEGDVQLSKCKSLSKLPKGFKVAGNLELVGCKSLVALPDGLCVAGDLILRDCTGLTAVPGDLSVAGELDLSECTKLIALPGNLSVPGNLNLWRCSRLTCLPDGLSVGRNLYLSKCVGLTGLPNGLSVGRNLYLSECTGLSMMPDQLCVGGNLYIPQCPQVTELPDALSVGGKIDLSHSTGLTKLPENLHVKGTLNLMLCTSLTLLPVGLRVDGDLNLRGCTGLTSLPNDLSITKGLRLSYCTGLTALPDELCVRGKLELSGCTSLTSLPERLTVSGSLHLSGCTSLTALPAELCVGVDLFLENCFKLESLPSSILSGIDPSQSRSGLHNIYLGGSGLSQDTLEWLRTAEVPNVRFHVDLRGRFSTEFSEEALSEISFTNLSRAISFWEQEAHENSPLKKPLPTLLPTESSTVLQFLSKLRGAKEFGIMETRRTLAQRVLKALGLLNNPECRAEVIQRMEDSLDACHDKPVWALNQLTLVGLVSSARGDRDALRSLGRRVMSLQIVHAHVEKKIATLSWVDDVCVYLRFEIELLEPLHLPVDATAMIFSNYIPISDAELKAAQQEASEVSDEAFKLWLSSWAEWQRQERLEVAEGMSWEGLDFDPGVDASKVPRTDLSGEVLVDPVVLRRQVWSLRDLLRHWVQTGLDLTNGVLSIDDLTNHAKRVRKRKSLRQSIRRSLRALVEGKPK